jgi:superfamily II DNA or RNA helicase
MKSDSRHKKTKYKTRKASKSASTGRAMSNLVCPSNMSLEQWQRELRSREATKRNMYVEVVSDDLSDGVFYVTGRTRKYRTVYYAAGSPWNFCSCMDFKTNGLGTCKHLEAVRQYLANRKGAKSFPLPEYSSLYLSYNPTRCVKLRLGETNREEMAKVATAYFKKDYSLRKGMECSIEAFIAKAKAIDPDFRIYSDAMDYILQIREAAAREKTLQRYDDNALNSLLSVPLYEYQREGVRFAFLKGKAIIADEMGLGKTIQAIATAELLRKEGYVGSVLIMCPTSLKYQWKKEIERFTSASVLVVEGTHIARTRAYREDPSTYKIVSYHSIANDIKVYKSMDCDMIIMDEVQRLKNWDTQIAKAARNINTNYAVVLSGTPLENKLEELYSVMQFVDQYCLGPFYQFRNEAIVTDGETEKVIGYKNLNKIGEKAATSLIRRTKKQVALQMPERTDKILYVDMTEQQRAIHDDCKVHVANLIHKWRRFHFLSEQDRKKLMLNLNIMRMVCDSTFIIDQSTRYQTKIDEVIDIINDAIEGSDTKIVVFSQWERMARLLSFELEKRGIEFEFLHGGVPSKKRKDLMDNFTDNPQSRVFISTDAGATGLNLQAASLLINLDLPWNPAVLEQRIARIYRIGQKRNIQVINMVARDSIEERMLSTLNFKSGLFAGILDAGEDAIFLENSKFDKIIDTFADVVEPTQQDEPQAESQSEVQSSNSHKAESQQQPQASTSDNKQLSSQAGRQQTSDVINQGITFFKGLSEILSDEAKTKELVDTIVHTDESTGETAIHIPVSDKATVQTIFSALSKLFAK